MVSKSQLKQIRALHQKKYREQEGRYIAEGLKLLEEALHSIPSHIERIIHTPDSSNAFDFKKIPRNIIVNEVTSEDFRKISVLENPQGIMSVIRKPELFYTEASLNEDLILMLDGVRDPGNLGTIIRIADWFGIGRLICSPDTVECYNTKVVQASMGSIFRVAVQYESLTDYLEGAAKKGIHIYGASLKGENIYTTSLSLPAILVLGSESHGISDEISELAGKKILIPHFNKSEKRAESLNVSISAAILCSEFRRRK